MTAVPTSMAREGEGDSTVDIVRRLMHLARAEPGGSHVREPVLEEALLRLASRQCTALILLV